jgi:hypothetical protein
MSTSMPPAKDVNNIIKVHAEIKVILIFFILFLLESFYPIEKITGITLAE